MTEQESIHRFMLERAARHARRKRVHSRVYKLMGFYFVGDALIGLLNYWASDYAARFLITIIAGTSVGAAYFLLALYERRKAEALEREQKMRWHFYGCLTTTGTDAFYHHAEQFEALTRDIE